MLLVTIPLGLPNIINDNVSDFFAAMFLGQKVLSKCGCSDFGKVLVLRNGEHFLFGQAAQSDAIFKRNHSRLFTLSQRELHLYSITSPGQDLHRQDRTYVDSIDTLFLLNTIQIGE
jgi:hypothetical protein